MRPDIFREKSPLSADDCFVVFDRRKSSFTFPVHIHPEYELNYVEGASGAQRIIGNSVETIGEQDLVLIASPELEHAWKDGECQSSDIHEITIQFHPSLIEQYLDKKQFASIQQLLSKASRGVVFGKDTVDRVLPLLRILTLERDGFYSVMKLFVLLYELSKGEDIRVLSTATNTVLSNSELLMGRLQEYVVANINKELSLPMVAAIMNMSKSTFSRFLKSATTLNFTDYLLDFRINMAVRLLKEETPIADIVEQCGFNSVSYFYRVFKKKKGITPIEYRNSLRKQQMII
ncbi:MULTISPECIES: AraC family transcriptional regulator [Sphingobacterium]|uniref:AraC family transcriptional regulator n=1 Tax=Sphingobacterium athyrii TaxID=2152717 RepID=A0A363NS09_9SPHI|nr:MULTISPECIES: AraC family transcriptional regulator [Sphingobacterium]PUV23517.1 AraC family transcriptional regulator [Sphingobacterium athyrii]